MLEGRICKGIGGFYYVECPEGRLYECRPRGIFRKEKQEPLVGDRVKISVLSEDPPVGSIEEILPRKNELIRPRTANVDQALIIFACGSPEWNPVLLDRFLVMLRSQDIPCYLCLNKKDLIPEEERQARVAAYAKADVLPRCISAKEASDIEELKSLLRGRTTLLAGPSGVGKSTILNAICPEAKAQTGEISRKLGRGKHTTRHAELFMAEGNIGLCDTPGFTALSLYDMPEDEVKAYYPEFYPYEEKCRFTPCSHTHEPDCAVKQAVEEGEIPRLRYTSYTCIYREQKERKRF